MSQNLRLISNKIDNISTSRVGVSNFSTDLDSGRRPMLKSVEKCETPILDVKIWDPQFSTFGPNETLIGISSRTSLPVFAVPPQSDSVSSTRPREEWVAYSFERFVAAIKTRYTPHPDDMYSPTRQPAKPKTLS